MPPLMRKKDKEFLRAEVVIQSSPPNNYEEVLEWAKGGKESFNCRCISHGGGEKP